MKKPKQMAKTRQSAKIRFTDIGSGQAAQRIKRLAERHPRQGFEAVDTKRRWVELPENAVYVQSTGLSHLAGLPSESRNRIFMDFALENILEPGLAKMKGELQKEKAEKMWEHEARLLIKQAHRVLEPRGAIVLTVEGSKVKQVNRLLNENNFTTKIREMLEPKTPEEWAKLETPALAMHWRSYKSGSFAGDKKKPHGIMAWKRKKK